jgi:signal recognition particle receptor subunit beta
MTSINILILSGDDTETQQLIAKLNERAENILIAGQISEAAELISSTEPFLFLINYHSIVKSERKELISLFKNAQKTKFVVYAVPNDATRRLAFYGLGAYRILDDRFNMEDLYHFCVNTIRTIPTDSEIREAHFSGSLEDFNLAGLINIFGKEKRSGILRIQTPISSGKIFFDHGNIYHAVAGNLKQDDAVFYMLTWHKGWFSMRPLTVASAQNRMQLSNIGLLLHSEPIRNKFVELTQKLGGLSRQVRIINQGDLIHSSKDPQFREFIEKLSDFRGLHDVIELSPFSLLNTLAHLNKLVQSKNIEFRETAGEIDGLYVEEKADQIGLAEKFLTEEEVSQLRQNLNAQDISSGKLIILGTHTSGKTDFIRNFNQGSLSNVRTNQELDFTKIELEKDFYLQVFGLAIDKRLTDMIEKLTEGLVGYIFLIDAENPEEFEYTNYIINHLMTMYPAPWSAAITNLNKGDQKSEKKIQSAIRFPESRELKVCDVTDRADVHALIMSMRVNQIKEEPAAEEETDA